MISVVNVTTWWCYILFSESQAETCRGARGPPHFLPERPQWSQWSQWSQHRQPPQQPCRSKRSGRSGRSGRSSRSSQSQRRKSSGRSSKVLQKLGVKWVKFRSFIFPAACLYRNRSASFWNLEEIQSCSKMWRKLVHLFLDGECWGHFLVISLGLTWISSSRSWNWCKWRMHHIGFS